MEGQIASYLRQATIHACFNSLKQRRNRKEILLQADWIASPTPSENAQSLTLNELESEARRAIEKLPPRCREIFLLSRQEEMKYQEIADHLQISIKTVEQQMGIALEKLRDYLKPFLTKEFIIPMIIFALLFLLAKIFQS